MNTDSLDFDALRRLVRSYFGRRVSIQTVSPSVQEMVFLLYDAFVFKAEMAFDDNSFGVVMVLPDQRHIQVLLGQKTTMRCGGSDARVVLEIIDDYCRRSLPEKYLDAFDSSPEQTGTVTPTSDSRTTSSVPVKPTFVEVVAIVEEFFGDVVMTISAAEGIQEFNFVLYDSFVFKAGVDVRYGSFGVILLLPSRASVRLFLGKKTTLRTGEDQIRGALQAIDAYCRLRLPDNYLQAFELTLQSRI